MNLPVRVAGRSSLVAIAMGVALGLALSPAFAQVLKGSHVPMNVKLGLWEMTTVVQMSGTPPMDTSGMTAEQKARIEATMKMMQQNAGKPRTTRSCVTKEKLEKGFMERERNESCEETVLESTSTTFGIKFQCGGQHPSNGEWHFVAVTPEMVKGTGTFSLDGGKTNSSTTSTGKWISASCGDVK